MTNPVSMPDLRRSGSQAEAAAYSLPEIRKKLETLCGAKLPDDDPSLFIVVAVDMMVRDYSSRWMEECSRAAMEEYKQGLDAAANDKKRDLRQELISLAAVIHDKLKVETDAIHRPLITRIEELKQIATTIGANYYQYRWHDRIVGLLCASLLFLAAFASGMVFELFKR
jgi:hypothetical protein